MSFQRFGTNYQFRGRFRLCQEMLNTVQRSVISRKGIDLIYIAAKAVAHVNVVVLCQKQTKKTQTTHYLYLFLVCGFVCLYVMSI